MKEYTPLVRRSSLPRPDRASKGAWDSLLHAHPELADPIARLSQRQIADATVLPTSLRSFDPRAAEPKSAIPSVAELHDALIPHEPQTSHINHEHMFQSPSTLEKIDIINSAFDFHEAKKGQRKQLIQKTITRFIEDPEYCMTYYQTLREYEENNPEQLRGRFHTLRGELNSRLVAESQSQTAAFLKAPSDAQESRMGTMLQVILPSIVGGENAEGGDAPEQQGAREAALVMRKILRGLIRGTNTGDEIVQLMYSLTVGGLTHDSDIMNTVVYGINTFVFDDIFKRDDPQVGRYLAASYAPNDDTFAKMTLLDYTTTILDKLYESNHVRLDGLRDVIMRTNTEFIDAMKRVTATMDPAKKKPEEREAARRLQAKMDFLEDKTGTDVDSSDEISDDGNMSPYLEEVPYPGNFVAGNYKLRHLYNTLLSRNLMQLRQIEEPIVLIATPADGLLRNVERVHGSPVPFAEKILRHAYGIGTGKTIKQKHVIENALTYLKPVYESSELNDYAQAEFSFHITPTFPKRETFLDVKLKGYTLPLILDTTGQLRHRNGGPLVLDPDKKLVWEQAATEAYVEQYNNEIRLPLIANLSGGNERRVEANQVDDILISLRPPIIPAEKYTELAKIRDKKHELLESPLEAYGLSAFGNHVPVSDVRTGCGTSSLFFNWGKAATTDVDVQIGKTTLPLKLDIHYNLVRRDGLALRIDEQTKTWWESIILSHLGQLLTIPRSPERETPGEGTGDLNRNTRKPVTTHRRLLEVGKHASAKQSAFIEKVNADDDDPRKVPLHITVPPGEHYLQTWNRMLGRDGMTLDTREYTWVLPSDNAIAGYPLEKRPVTKKLPTALSEIQALDIV